MKSTQNESKHFPSAQLRCHHCRVNLCTPELLDAMEAYRAIKGLPVRVNDAYRCKIHNEKIGGALNSQHVSGNAADIRIEGLTAAELYAIALQVPAIKGIGRADHQGYIHIDVRETPAKWCYNTDGKEIPWYDVADSGPIK